uniref:Carrier domain-containing protein n=1 Tax=Thermosporothrix sp. COM3 TaxID=2490863 RepID=A0A455SIH6_9CHLR|nr:hypothetical protein KTC_18920 [Thermosporothrix sp. COM3]
MTTKKNPSHILSSHKMELFKARLAQKGLGQRAQSEIPHRKEAPFYPLSFAQQRLWFLDQMEPGNPAYNNTLVITLEGYCHLDALQQSLQEIIHRQESLRTTFHLHEGQPVQSICTTLPLHLPYIDLSHLAPEQREKAALLLAQQDANQPFDLTVGPLFRMRLLCLKPQEHRLVLTLHHIISDGWSEDVLLKELITLYQAFVDRKPSPLPALPLQYADYALWQRSQDDRVEQQLAYWREQLRDLSPFELPTDHPRPAVQTFHGAYQEILLPCALQKELKALSQRENATLFMTLQAAFHVLLSRYTGQTDLTIGTPSANRTRPEVEGIIGFFVNSIALRVNLADNPTFIQLLTRVRSITIEAYTHQEIPFEKVVDELKPERSLSHMPLFQIFFTEQQAAPTNQEAAGLRFHRLEQGFTTAKFDLSLLFVDTPQGIQTVIEYNTDLFEAVTIQRLLTHWRILLQGIVHDPTKRLDELPLLSEEEREMLLSAWQGSEKEHSIRADEWEGVHHLFERRAAEQPDAIALTFDDEQITYARLNQEANRLASFLQQRGVQAETPVGLFMERSFAMVVGMLGILKAGGTYVPLAPDYPQDRLAFILDTTRISLIVTLSPFLERLPGQTYNTICLDSDQPGGAIQPVRNPRPVSHPEQLAYILYTSGSTGQPKGVMISHKALSNHMHWMLNEFAFTAEDHFFQKTPFGFDASVWEFYAPLLIGARMVIAEPGGHQDPAYLMRTIQEQGVTVLQLVPTLLKLLLAEPDFAACTTLRSVFAGGEPLTKPLLQSFSETLPARLYNLYGPTETTIDTTFSLCIPEDRRQRVPIGRPINNVQVYLLDAHFQLVPPGMPGELYIGGEGVGRGYLNRPDLTAERFLPHPFSKEPGARLYKTGDLARYHEDGTLEFLERLDSQIKLRGHRVEPGEIEAALLLHPLVQQALVLLQSDPHPMLVAYLVAQDQAQAPTAEQLRQHLHASLPDYMIPSHFLVLPHFPLNANGKLDRRALPAPSLSATSTNEAPRSPLEAQLHSIWQAVLQLDTFGIHDNFFSLGGDSILSIQVVSRAAQAGLSLSPRHLFQYQTIAQLAAFLHTLPDTATPITPAQAETLPQELPLLPIMQWFLDQQPANPHHFNQSILLQLQAAVSYLQMHTALTQLVQRHDAFQLFLSGNLLRRREQAESPALQQVTLDALSPDEQQTTIEQVAEQAHASLSLEHGPLLRAVLFTRGQQPSLLLLVIHHLAVDSVSWRIILSDLNALLQAARANAQPQLPPPGPSFWQWGHALLRYVHTHADALRQQLPFWLAQHPPTAPAFPLDQPQGQNLEASSRIIEVTLPAEETRALLQQVPHAYQTRVQDVLLSALLLAFSEWTEHPSLLLHLEGHGRVDLLPDIDLSQTVGWFTALYPLLLELPAHRDPASVLKSVKEQLRRLPEQGIGYGLLRYLHPDEQVRRSFDLLTEPQLIFNYQGQFDQTINDSTLFQLVSHTPGSQHSPENRRSHLISIDGMVANGCLSLQWEYSSSLHAPTTIQQLATSFLSHLHSLIQHCLLPQAHGFTPSDFPLASLSQAQLDSLALPPSVEDLYPLSPLQAGMLFHAHEASGSDLYIQLAEFRLQGALDPQRLRDAFATVQHRHPILRTSFLWHELEHPLQVVFRRAPFPWLFADWRSLSPDVQQLRLEKLRQEEQTRGFDLTNAPLFRVHLIQLAERQWVLLWCFHHILLDGWSLPLLFSEILQTYKQEGSMLTPPLPYRDYIAWLQQQDQHQALSYWRRLLAGFSTPTRLPFDYLAPLEEQQQQHDFEEKSISREETRALIEHARREQLTVNTLLQAAWAFLLSRYSGSNDVLFGTTVAGRPTSLAGIEHTAGLFINTLPVRVQLPVHQPLSDWLRELQIQQAEARHYEYAPLLEIQRCSEVPAGQRLFDTLLVFENYPFEDATLSSIADLNIQPIQTIEKTNYPLVVDAVIYEERLILRITYDAACFKASTIERLLAQFQLVLRQLASGTHRHIDTLALLTEEERHRMLVEWNAKTAPYPTTRLFHQLFTEQTRYTPDAIAVTHGDEQICYAELDRRSDLLAARLRLEGVGPEVVVAIALERSIPMLITLLAILKAGGAYVPLDLDYPPDRLAFILENAGASLLISSQQIARATGLLDKPIKRIAIEEISWQEEHSTLDTPPMRAEQLAYVIYTSGSTGRPKGAMLSHAGMINHLFAKIDALGLTAHDRVAQTASLSFDISVWQFLAPLLLGGCVYILSNDDIYQPTHLCANLRTLAITTLELVPAQIRMLLEELETGTTQEIGQALRWMISTGEAIPPQLCRRWLQRCPYIPLVNTYGATECSDDVTHEVIAEQPSERSINVSVGQPIANMQIYILDDSFAPVPIGVAGHIYIGGVGVGRGYIVDPVKTAESFLPDPFSNQPGARMYRTGDRGRYWEDGRIECLGRLDSQIKLRGHRVEPGEIEAALLLHPLVQQAVVLLQSDPHPMLVAYLVAQDQAQAPTAEQLRQHLHASLPDYMIPSHFLVLPHFPLNANGKLDRRALPAPSLPAASTNEAPRSPLEAQLHSIWQAVLQLDTFGIHDNFFSLGGDSILSIQVVSRAAQAGLSLSPRHLFQYQTIAQLAAFLHTQPDTATPITPAQAETLPQELPLLPIMQWFLDQQPANPHHFNQSILLQLQTAVSYLQMHTALTQLVQRHDAFQLFLSGNLLRRREQAESPALQQVTLDALSPDEQQTTIEQVAEQAHASLSLEHGPLLRAVLFTRGQQPSLLLLVIHHLAVDSVSWRVILSELQTILHALLAGKQPQLPPPGPSFWQWGHALLRYVHTHADALRQQLPFWLAQHPASAPAFPLDQPQGQNLEASSRIIEVTLPAEETRALLQQVPHAYQTRVQDVLLSALLLAFSEWTEHPSLLLHLEGHGRVDLLPDIDLSQTVGWFTALYPLLLELPAHRDPASVLKSVKEQLRRLPEQGIGYGLLRYLHPDEAVRHTFVNQALPQLSFNYQGQFDQTINDSTLFQLVSHTPGSQHSPENRRSHLISIDGMVANGCLSLQWEYSSSLHAPTTIQQLATSFLSHLHSLIQHCLLPQAHGFTPSDFPLASLSQAQLDSLALPPSVEDLYPLSPLQAGMLFHTQFDPNSKLYVHLTESRLQGELDPQRLRDAFATVQQRHPILRTSFLWHELEHPLQVVFRRAPFPWLFADWRSLPPDVQQLRLEKLRQEEQTRGFDLTNAPLFRVHLIQLAERQWVLLWCFHHILLDGWSLPLLFQEALHFYEHAHLLTLETARPYRDYIAWLQQQDQHQALSYWRRLLAGFSTPTRLPIQHPAPLAQQQQQYAVLHLSCDQEHTASLLACAKREQLTMNTLLQAAWALLLSRYSGSNDVLFGTTVAGRPASLAGIEHTAGLFINTLPVRVQLPVHQPLSDWLRELQAQQAEARLYEYAPLFEIQRCSEVPAGQRLFDTLLVFENYPFDASLSDATRQLQFQEAYTLERTNYPLMLQAMMQQERLELRLTYDTACFDASPLQRLLNHLLHILLSLAHNTSNTPEQLSLIPHDELDTLLTRWNQTRTPYPATRTLPLLFAEQVQRTPDAIALLFEDEQLTYAELQQRVNQLAAHLRTRGAKPESHIGIYMERSATLLISLLAVLKAGATYIPLDPTYPQERIAFIMADTDMFLVLTQQHLLDTLPPCTAQLLCLDNAWQQMPEESDTDASYATQSAYIIYTSGSTGVPKGVILQHQSLTNFLYSMQQTLQLDRNAIWLAVTSISFDIAGLELFLPIISGGRVVIANREAIADSTQLIKLLAHSGATVMQATPATWQQLLMVEWTGQPHLTILCGGEALPVELARQLAPKGEHFWNLYGPTETTIWSTMARVTAEEPPSIGRPIANTQIYLLDSSLQPVPIGIPGDLYIGGDGLARGYLNRPDNTAERFIPSPFSEEPGARLYRTGDIARYREDGSLEYLGRADYQVKIRGFRIEPGEIESILTQHEAVQEAVVRVWEVAPGDVRLVAYLIAATGHDLPSEEAFRQYLLQKLPAYMLPAHFLQVTTWPLTPNGKLNRQALPLPDEAETRRETHYVAPRNAAEEVFTEMWKQLLQVEQVGVYDNFFTLGGHSLLATRFIARLKKLLHLDLPIRVLFDKPTIAELAELLTQQQGVAQRLNALARAQKQLHAMTKEQRQAKLQQQERKG